MTSLGALGTDISGSNAQECYMVARPPLAGSGSGGATQYAIEWHE